MESSHTSNPSLRNLKDPNFGKIKSHQNENIQQMVKPHIDSFNWFCTSGIHLLINDIQTEFLFDEKTQVSFFFKQIELHKPEIVMKKYVERQKYEMLLPSECRQRAANYMGRVEVELGWKINQVEQIPLKVFIGYIPVMVKSALCHLHNLSPSELVNKGEEAEEAGGYFIAKGIEKVMRMLIFQRKNYPMSIERPKWKDKGPLFSPYGISILSIKPDLSFASKNILHYLTNGAAILSFSLEKQEFLIPVIILIRALSNQSSDDQIYRLIINDGDNSSLLASCVRNMLRDAHNEGLNTRTRVLSFMGSLFRIKLSLPPWYSDAQIANYLIKKLVLIHLTKPEDKVNLLIFMTRKLFSFSQEKSCMESPDNCMFQEVLLPGNLFQMFMAEKLEIWLNGLKYSLLKCSKLKNSDLDEKLLAISLRRVNYITNGLIFLISTGKIISKTGLGLMQDNGLVIVAERLNYYRFLSHFRAVHRGSFFMEMRTTSVRKLYPETWGFLCPVHTPDGAPCGLLNHLTFYCRISNNNSLSTHIYIIKYLVSIGVVPCDAVTSSADSANQIEVLLDGKIIGWLKEEEAEFVTSHLRRMKVNSMCGIPDDLEICLVVQRDVPAQYPGLYLFSTSSRFIRPVINRKEKKVELIGSFEQVYLNICINDNEKYEGLTGHQELNHFSMMSDLANLTPFSNFNQSCRNMYQCQMAKQTMGTPLLSWQYRNDNKQYRLTTPQSPLVRSGLYDNLELDEYPIGTNAIIAVMSYTGYDMEDAMIINKMSAERGFSHGSIYKNETVDLKSILGDMNANIFEFGLDPDNEGLREFLGEDGLPFVGVVLNYNDPFYCYKNLTTMKYVVGKFHGKEEVQVEGVKMCGDGSLKGSCNMVQIYFRISRNPIIGDKYSSRHGQKGICSQFYKTEDMPFTSTGMVPDIIFNPHGFPSRMTIGMMIELMAGKSASEHGEAHNSSTFIFNSDNNPIKYFGQCLQAAGYNYYGTEVLHSGVSGNVLEAYIFTGVVYYQRLRHMVLDKWQVRSTGAVDSVTQQPIGGRKKEGGVRFGEMERDAIIAHGCSFILQERLTHASDGTEMPVCRKCGSLISPIFGPPKGSEVEQTSWNWKCLSCGSSDTIGMVYAPFVLKYFASLLATTGVKMEFEVEEG